MVINVDKNVPHALDFWDADDGMTTGIESTSSLVTISEFEELVIGILDFGFWILDFADEITRRFPPHVFHQAGFWIDD
jgi:hypothetical protein